MNALAFPLSPSAAGFFANAANVDSKGLFQALGRWQSAGTDAAFVGNTPNSIVEVGAKNMGTLTQTVAQTTSSFEEKVFDSLVSLKVAVSLYANHLPRAERTRIFGRLDEVINIDDWHEEDAFPTRASFVNFLKWIVFSKSYNWSSIGAADNGNILVAWTQPGLTLTANFFPENKVTWAANVRSENGSAQTVGSGPLHHFAKQAHFYLSGGAAA